MKIITSFLFVIIFGIPSHGQKSIDLKECEILTIDSITLCSSHYSIKLLTSVDTFCAVVDKSLIIGQADSLVGRVMNIRAETIKTLVLDINDSIQAVNLIGILESHREFDRYSKTQYNWKVKKTIFRKQKVSLTLSYICIDKKQSHLRLIEID